MNDCNSFERPDYFNRKLKLLEKKFKVNIQEILNLERTTLTIVNTEEDELPIITPVKPK